MKDLFTLEARLDQISALMNENMTPEQIATTTGLKESSVHIYMTKIRRKGSTVTTEATINIYPNTKTMSKLRSVAKERNLKTRHLIELVLETIVEDELFTAILDE